MLCLRIRDRSIVQRLVARMIFFLCLPIQFSSLVNKYYISFDNLPKTVR